LVADAGVWIFGLAWAAREHSLEYLALGDDPIIFFGQLQQNVGNGRFGLLHDSDPLIRFDLTRPGMYERLPGPAWAPAGAELRVNQLGQQLQTIDDPRAGPAEICVAVDGIYAALTHRRQCLPAGAAGQHALGLLDSPLQVEAAWRDDDHLRRERDHVIPGHPARVVVRGTQPRTAAGQLDQLGQPMARAEERV